MYIYSHTHTYFQTHRFFLKVNHMVGTKTVTNTKLKEVSKTVDDSKSSTVLHRELSWERINHRCTCSCPIKTTLLFLISY